MAGIQVSAGLWEEPSASLSSWRWAVLGLETMLHCKFCFCGHTAFSMSEDTGRVGLAPTPVQCDWILA